MGFDIRHAVPLCAPRIRASWTGEVVWRLTFVVSDREYSGHVIGKYLAESRNRANFTTEHWKAYSQIAANQTKYDLSVVPVVRNPMNGMIGHETRKFTVQFPVDGNWKRKQEKNVLMPEKHKDVLRLYR
ncbi:hypothetical protein ACFQZT_10765 [Paenibacillus sp. GCM10027628]|uniref:hypothetical protein n=1 Tax=Paenibacillus sp. GCM10027628 TaxID=3273413 RepID=UPI003643B1AD